MGEFAGFDLDKSTRQAWRRFQARLADHLPEMDDDDLLIMSAESPIGDQAGACPPYVQFCAFGEVMLRGELSSNEYLTNPHVLDPEAVERLTAMGWNPPTAAAGQAEGQGSANFYLDVERSQADELALMTVRALRDCFGVPHPAFLSTGELAEDSEAPKLEMPYTSSPLAASEDEPLAVMPGDAGALHQLVDAALASLFGQEVEKDDDGDVPVPWGSALVFVRVHDELPLVELFGTVASEVKHLDRAAFEVAVLNRDVRFIKFVLVEDSVLAFVHLPAQPFVPEHLRSMLVGMANKLDAIGEDLVARIGGRRPLDDREPDVDDTGEAPESTSVESTPTRRELRVARPTSPQVQNVTRVEDLLCAHGRTDLYELDELLSTSSDWDFEVFDLEDGIEVWIGDVGMGMDYPFKLADFKELVGEVETLAEEEAEKEEDA